MLLPGLFDRSVSPRHTTSHGPSGSTPSSLALSRRVDAAGLVEYRSILADPDAELRAEALLGFARRQEQAGRVAVAAELYQALAEAGLPANIAARARAQGEAIFGIGAAGGRAEFLLRRLAAEACDPAGLAGLALAGGVFRVARLATLGRLAATPSLGAFSRGFLARATASTAAFALEAPAFTLGTRTANQILGREVDWDARALGRDLASSYLVLGGLKLAGFASGAAYRGLAGPERALREGPLRAWFQQGGMLGGILAGHWLETQAGLRPRQAGATTLVDSLSLLLQFHVAGRLASHALGEGLGARERALDLQAEALARALSPRRAAPPNEIPPAAWALAGAGVAGRSPPGLPELLLGLQTAQMSATKDGKGPGPRWGDPAPAREPGTPRGAEPRVSQEAMTEEVDVFLRGVENPELGLRAFVDGLPIAAAVARIKGEEGFGRIFIVNRKFTELFGYNERQAGEHPITHFFSMKSAPFIAARIWTILRGGVFQATKMDFLCRDGNYRKIWGSGVVRSVYGETFAFGFYEPRDENQAAQPQVPASLKVFQAADGARVPSLDAEGFFELRSTIELSLQLTHPDSPLIRHFLERDLRVRVAVPDHYDAGSYTESMTRGLNLLARKTNIVIGRKLAVELRDSFGRRRSLVEWVRRGEGFVATEVTPTPVPSVGRTVSGMAPVAVRGPRPGLFAEVSRALSDARPGPGETPADPRKKDPTQR